MTRLVLHEVARWVRAVGAPLAVLAIVVVTPRLLPAGVGNAARFNSDHPFSIAWITAGAAALAWLATAGARAALQPARDRRAAEHLQDLRVRAGLPDHALLCVLRVLWESPAGQRLTAVNVRTGTNYDLWLAEAHLAIGTYALVSFGRGAGCLLGSAPHTAVVRARHHASRSDASPVRANRRERRDSARIVRAAEMLLHADEGTRHGHAWLPRAHVRPVRAARVEPCN